MVGVAIDCTADDPVLAHLVGGASPNGRLDETADAVAAVNNVDGVPVSGLDAGLDGVQHRRDFIEASARYGVALWRISTIGTVLPISARCAVCARCSVSAVRPVGAVRTVIALRAARSDRAGQASLTLWALRGVSVFP